MFVVNIKEMNYFTIENLEITDAGAEGKAVGKHEGLTVFVPYAVPGDVVDVQVFKKKKGYAESYITAIKKPSADRIQPECQHFGLCGGCKWQILTYEKQLYYKQKQVFDNFKHLGKFDFPEISPIIGSEKQYFYRNKLEFTFSSLRWLDEEDKQRQEAGEKIVTDGLGFHIPGKFDKVLDIQKCYLQADPANDIRLSIKQFAMEHQIPFFNVRLHEGVLRNLVIRSSSTGELMVIVVMTELNDKTRSLLQFVAERFPEITSLLYCINTKFNDSITDLEMVTFKGNSFMMEQMEDLKFKVGPVSFYQTNNPQAYNLYKTAREFAQIGKDDVVYDLYTGSGTIANFVARQAKLVVGIEYVDEAIVNAKENSKINGIDNTRFFAGDMAKVFTPEFIKANGTPDIVITDPPRAGMHEKVIDQLLAIAPKRIVYVSCNPATQARDLTLLCRDYKVTRVQPVDMFPHTQHVENVVLLERIG